MEENTKSFWKKANEAFEGKLAEYSIYINEVIPKEDKMEFIEKYSKIGTKELAENGELEK